MNNLETFQISLKDNITPLISSFINFYGENRVEIKTLRISSSNLQDLDKTYLGIIVYYPSIKITNERGDFTTIYDVFCQVTINGLGELSYMPISDYESPIPIIGLYKTTFTIQQFKNRYLHSHCPRFDTIQRSLIKPAALCLGTSPIQRTISSHNSNTKDQNICDLFVYELDQLLQVESISGHPYISVNSLYQPNYYKYSLDPDLYAYQGRLRQVKALLQSRDFQQELIKSHLLENITYSKSNKLIINKNNIKLWIDLSNFMKAYLDEHNLLSERALNDLFRKVFLIDGNFYEIIYDFETIKNLENSSLSFKFKDKEFPIKIISDQGNNLIYYTIINKAVFEYILQSYENYLTINNLPNNSNIIYVE